MSLVYKFGGSIIKDASTFKLIADKILQVNSLRFVVLSATFNTTNRLERCYSLFFDDVMKSREEMDVLVSEHVELCRELSIETKGMRELFFNVYDLAEDLDKKQLLDEFYSIGERASSLMMLRYLRKIKPHFAYLDIRKYLITDDNFTNAEPLMWESRQRLQSLEQDKIYITQGFIGSTRDGKTTTLGREGSDYTGAIISWAIDATEFVIWKDVNGVYSIDPKLSANAQVLAELSYDACKLITKNGAKILFERTMEPLENKKIPLVVRSIFESTGGTRITNDENSFFNLSTRNGLVFINVDSNFLKLNYENIREKIVSLENNKVVEEGVGHIAFLPSDIELSQNILHDFLYKLSQK